MQVKIAQHGFGTIIWDGVYYFVLSDYPHITPWELKKLLYFMDYEKKHGRAADILCEDGAILTAVNHALSYPETMENALPPTRITECTYCNQKGCLAQFVCHTASPENAKRILKTGKLLSAVKAFGKSADSLVLDSRNAAGDPADYFDYVMFAWGNCTAGDNLVMERKLGRGPTADELENGLTPGVRFYFRYNDIVSHPGYIFDGYHPAKVKDELELLDYLYACIIPAQYKDEFEDLIDANIMKKIYFLPHNGLGIRDWAGRAHEFIKGLGGEQA